MTMFPDRYNNSYGFDISVVTHGDVTLLRHWDVTSFCMQQENREDR